MFRRFSPPVSADPLLDADLPDRVRVAHTRLSHQDDPALTHALSERELDANRRVAEQRREHRRREELARLQSAESAADQARRATAEIGRADADDLVTARKALAEQRREASPHAQLAHLYRIKKWSGRALGGVVMAAMLWSAVNVQQNIAPTGPSDPLFWASYLLEALISTVLVVFMISGSASARWKVTDGEDPIRKIEVALLAATITLNTYPYFSPFQAWDVLVHSVAPVMIGVALFGHDAVGKRLGAAIEQASAQLPPEDDIVARLDALTAAAHPSAGQPSPTSAPDQQQTRTEVHPEPEEGALEPQMDPAAADAPLDMPPQVHPEVHSKAHPLHPVHLHPVAGEVHLHSETPATLEHSAGLVSLEKPSSHPPRPEVHRIRSARTSAPDPAGLAAELVRTKETTKPVDTVTQVLAQADQGIAPTTIAKTTGAHHRTVSRILAAAERIRHPHPHAVGGGRVIDLDRRTAQ